MAEAIGVWQFQCRNLVGAMTEERFQVTVEGNGVVTAIRARPEEVESGALFIYAPGAGSNLLDPFGVFACQELARANFEAWRFQFPYMEAKRAGPDRPPVLEATWRSVVAAVPRPTGKLVVGGRSMGGRIASQVVAQGVDVAGLALLAYPLHPPGRPDQTRDAHLSSIKVPTLFCSGSRDAFASPEELNAAAGMVERARVHLLEGADHGFGVLKSGGRTRQDVWAEAVAVLLSFLGTL